MRIPNPNSPHYKDKICDHAACSLILTEAGGVVTDLDGKTLDFSVGKKMINNRGILGSIPPIHNKALDVLKALGA